MRKQRLNKSKILIHIVMLGGIFHLAIHLTNNGIQSNLVRQSGEYAIWALVLILICSPMTTVFGWNSLKPLKKPLGIYSFIFAAIHLSVFIGVNRWRISLAMIEIFSELNLIIATLSMIIMTLLFLTSNRTSTRLLKKGWKKLHRLVYPASLLAIGHILFINDKTNLAGFKYLILVILLLAIRLPKIKRFFIQRRHKKNQIKKEQMTSERTSVRPLFISVFFIGITVSLAITIHSTPSIAEDRYNYQRDGGFFAALFADDTLPVVNHQQTLKSCDTECHEAHQPGLLPERSWKKVMTSLREHFDEAVEISPDERQSIENYLVENAADYTKSSISMKVMSSSEGITPDRITELSFFTRHHEDIPRNVIKEDSIKSLANCRACHIDSDKTGNYDEANIDMPGRGKHH